MLYIEAELEVVGKPEPKDWKNDSGSGRTFRLNVAQNDGVDVATIRCVQSVFDAVRRGDVALLRCSFAEYGDRVDFRAVELVRILNMDGKPMQGAPVKSGASPAK